MQYLQLSRVYVRIPEVHETQSRFGSVFQGVVLIIEKTFSIDVENQNTQSSDVNTFILHFTGLLFVCNALKKSGVDC